MTADIIDLPARARKPSSRRNSRIEKPLTALQIKNHKFGFLSDAHPHRGLRLRANKNGTKTWTYRYRFDGKLKQIKLGTYPGMELAEARAALIKQRKLKEQLKDPRQVLNLKKQAVRDQEAYNRKQTFTFGVMVEQYLVERIDKDRKPKGAREVRRLIEYDLRSLVNIPVDKIEPESLHQHILSIAERAPDVARVFRSELARAWRYAINVGRTKTACLINTDTGGKLTQGKRTRYLSERELKLLLPWLHNYSRTVDDILTLTLYLGLRSGEVCKLRDDWFKKKDGNWWICIPATEMKKNHNDHYVPLVGTALRVAKRRSGNGLWFRSRTGNPIQQKVLGVEVYSHSGRSKAKMYQHKAVCPVSDWAPNDLRKTARSHLAAIGCPFEVAESVLHHMIPGVGGLYNRHEYFDEKRIWLTKLGDLFDGYGYEE